MALKRQTETVNETSISHLDLPFFMRAIPKGLAFRLCYMYYVCKICMFLFFHSTPVRFDLVKTPEVTLCG